MFYLDLLTVAALPGLFPITIWIALALLLLKEFSYTIFLYSSKETLIKETIDYGVKSKFYILIHRNLWLRILL